MSRTEKTGRTSQAECTVPARSRWSRTLSGMGLTLGLLLVACNSSPGTTPPGAKRPLPAAGSAAVLGVDSPGLVSGFLSDQLALATDMVNGWGPVERDMENGEQDAGDGEPLGLSGVKYAKGLGVHASSSLSFPLGAGCTVFRASVGLDDVVRPSGGGSVGFEVYGDDEKLFDSGVMRGTSATQEVNVSLAGRKSLRLVVTDGGDYIGYDHADWASARVECQDQAAPTPPVTPLPVIPPTPPSSGPLNKVSYTQSFENFRNPERGTIMSWQPYGTNDGLPGNVPPLGDGGVRNYFQGQRDTLPSSLIRNVYVLGEWRGGLLPQSFIDRFAGDLATTREMGLKMIPYFAYTWPLDENAASDAPTAQILAHLDQLRPALQANGDVIAFMYAGFIGPWGEWHESTNDNLTLDNKVNDNTRAILAKLLDVVPQNRAVTLRLPSLKQQLFGKAPLTAQEAFTGSAKSRIGFNSECYMADFHPDVRTLRVNEHAFLDQEGLYVPQAEMMDSGCFEFSAPLWKLVPCPDLLEEMRLTHPDATNNFEDPGFPVKRVDPDCQPEVKRRTGYRYRMLDSQMPGSARAGTELDVTLNMTNDGFGAIYNPRGLELVLRNKASGQDTQLKVNTPQDTRLFLPAPGETRALTLKAALPANLVSGQYDVLLALPDPAPSLHDRPAYAIQLANQNVWEDRTGFNALGQTINIQP